MTDLIEVHTTLPSREQANELARRLIESRLAACVQVLGPIESIYRWEGKVEQSQEWLLLIKTTSGIYQALDDAIQAAHPYSVPEIVALPASRVNEGYLSWVRSELDHR